MRVSVLIAALALAGCSGPAEEKKPDETPVEKPAEDGMTSDSTEETGEATEEEAPAPAAIDLDAVEDLETLFEVSGNVDKDQVAGIIGQKKPDVYKCYSDALAANPGMAGRVYVQITTTPDGGVASALVKQTTLKKPSVEQCMVGAIRNWEFPNDPSGGLVVIKYAFQLPP